MHNVFYDMMNMIVNRKIILIFLLVFVISCTSSSKKDYYTRFDLPLLKKNQDLRKQGNRKAVIMLNDQYLKIANQNKYEEGKALCYINLANLSLASGNFKDALPLLKKAEKILEHSENKFHKAILFESYATLNRHLELFDKALYYNAKALGIFKDMDNVTGKDYLLANAYSKRGDYLFQKSRFDSSLIYFHKYRNLMKDIGIECKLSEFHAERNNLDSAGIYMRQAQDIINSSALKVPPYDLFNFYLTSGNYYTKEQHYADAEVAYTEANKAMENIRQVYGSYFTTKLYKPQSDYYKKTGDHTKADYYNTLYIKGKAELANNQQEIIDATIDTFVGNIEREEQRYKRNMWSAISLLIIVVGGVGFYIYKRIKVLHLKRKALKSKVEELQLESQSKKQEEVIKLAKKNDSTFLVKFQEVYPEFVTKLQAINPDLEVSEITFAALISLNFTSKEISTYTFVQHTSVQQRKRRLRKRLNIPSDMDMYEFFQEL
ncbi:tetratricopeptide repeat protein [Elizabethkingia occulta]|uniref:tetratricopeptide repeat protein n=1 Tax=Elizabethkingia occulta TaxID=1867263 RepID=UPI00398C30B4